MLCLTAVILAAVDVNDAAAPLAGGPGFASFFTWTKPNTIGLLFNKIPTEAMTIEYWVRVTDPYLSQMNVFAYSCCTSFKFAPPVLAVLPLELFLLVCVGTDDVNGHYGEGGDPYEQANEIQYAFTPTFLRFFRGSSQTDCTNDENTACSVPFSGAYSWIHMGLTWHVNGTVNFYLNGSKVFEQRFDTGDGILPVQPGGILHVGQEADKPWGEVTACTTPSLPVKHCPSSDR